MTRLVQSPPCTNNGPPIATASAAVHRDHTPAPIATPPATTAPAASDATGRSNPCAPPAPPSPAPVRASAPSGHSATEIVSRRATVLARSRRPRQIPSTAAPSMIPGTAHTATAPNPGAPAHAPEIAPQAFFMLASMSKLSISSAAENERISR
jgi:hypothetical protein